MIKVVYNANCGGFCLSKKMIAELAKLGLKTNYAGEDENDERIPRHEARLVEVVERHIAAGAKTDLRICELRGNRYQIKEFDGFEEVIDPADPAGWVIAD